MIYSLIGRVIVREGGFVNHPDDRGGATNMGITLGTLASWRDCKVTVEDVENLSRVEAENIYYENYWKKPGLYTIACGSVVQEMLFDAAVHHGPTRAVKMLQACIGVIADGWIGEITQECAGRLNNRNLAALFMAERIEFIGALITRKPSQAIFAHGWMRRIAGLIQEIPLA